MEVYNLLYDNNNIPTWKEKLEPYRDAIKNISQVIYNNEKKIWRVLSSQRKYF